MQVEAPVEHEIYDKDESYNIDINWGPVRAVPVTMEVSKEVGKMAFDVTRFIHSGNVQLCSHITSQATFSKWSWCFTRIIVRSVGLKR